VAPGSCKRWLGGHYELPSSLPRAYRHQGKAYADEHRGEFFGARETDKGLCCDPERPAERDLAVAALSTRLRSEAEGRQRPNEGLPVITRRRTAAAKHRCSRARKARQRLATTLR
jgi:hypothetical protein